MNLDLTAQEQMNVRTALRFLRARMGGWKSVAKVLRFNETSIAHVVSGKKRVSETLAFRTARLAGVGVDELLAGKFPPPGTCAYCGHREIVD